MTWRDVISRIRDCISKRTRTALSGTFERTETQPWRKPRDPVLEAVERFAKERGEWEGSPSELAQALGLDMAVNRLTRHLNVSAARLLDEYHVKYESRTRHEGEEYG